MAVPSAAFRFIDLKQKDSDDSSSLSLTFLLQLDILYRLQRNFENNPNLIPVLALGHPQCGKSTILDNILGESANDFQSLESRDGGLVYFNPVQLGDKTLLLMEMSGMDFFEQDKEKRLLAEKLMYILLSVTSVAFVCLEKGSLPANLRSIFRIYAETKKRRRNFDVSKFFVFVESEEVLRGSNQKELMAIQEGLPSQCEYVARGRSGVTPQCMDFLRSELARLNEERSLEPSSRIYPSIQEFISTLQYLTDVANVSGSLQDLSEPLTSSQLEERSRMRSAIMTAQALNLFIHDKEDIIVNQETFSVINRNFSLEAPTVVMVIVGEPGLGKSTLLNSIMQYILHLSSPPHTFKTGNTTSHTTLESQVLSIPLTLPGTGLQLMLIDMEGLGGAETTNKHLATLQNLLVSSILAIASVPCIVIRNEIASKDFLNGKLEAISSHTKKFGFSVEQINLLFNDKDPSAGLNEHWMKEIQDAKVRHQLESTKIEIVNKPNFVASVRNREEMIMDFLRLLLDKSACPKKKLVGGSLEVTNIGEIMKQIREVVDSVRATADLILAPREELEVDLHLNNAKSRVLDIFRFLECKNEESSLTQLYEQSIEDLVQEVMKQLAQSPMRIKRKVEEGIRVEASQFVEELREIEELHDEIVYKPFETVKGEAIQHVNAANILIFLYLHGYRELEARLQKVRNRYLLAQVKVESLLQSLSSHRFYVVAFSFMHYLGNIFVCLGLIEEYRSIWATGAFLSLAGLILCGFKSKSDPRVFQNRKAEILAKVTETSTELTLDPTLHILSEDLTLVLSVGTTCQSVLLNAFARAVNPFALPQFRVFTDDMTGVRFMPFTFFKRKKQVSYGLLISIVIDASPGSTKYRSLVGFAGSLLTQSSRAFFFLDKLSGFSLMEMMQGSQTHRYYEDVLRGYAQHRYLINPNSDLRISVLAQQLAGTEKTDIAMTFEQFQLHTDIETMQISEENPAVKETGMSLVRNVKELHMISKETLLRALSIASEEGNQVDSNRFLS